MSDINASNDSSGVVTVSSSGAPVDASGENKNQVSYESFQKVLNEKKNTQARLNELELKFKEVEQDKLQAQGKEKELIASLQAQLKETRADFVKTKSSYALKTVKAQVELQAKGLGCVDTDLLTKAIDLEGLKITVVDDDYNVDTESLTSQLEMVRKSKPFLFKQAGPQIKDGVPGQIPSVDLSKMTTKQLIEFATKNPDLIK